MGQWCDSVTKICFQRWYNQQLDYGAGYLFPPATPASTEFIGIRHGKVGAGWLGQALGPSMESNPLIIAWVNSGTALANLRWAP